MQATQQATNTAIAMPVLKRNNTGEAVRFLQQLLIATHYLTSDAFDAKFNATTEEAVKYFQANNNLKPDGIVGDKTWRALGAAFV